MLSKLGSAYKKPANQTVIRNRAIPHFLSTFKFTKIRNLGGKLGDEIVSRFQTEQISDLLPHSLDTLKKHLGDDTGSWLYSTLRGEDLSEVNPRTQIKSMLSAKSFRPSINDATTATKWLRIFVSDIFSRLVEEGVLENKRRPKTMNLHHRCGQATRSKSTPIPLGRKITEDGLLELAKGLLAQVVVDGRAWPCANLSLSVGGFEEGISGNKGIGGFLVHGEEARALRESDEGRRGDSVVGGGMRPNKRRRVGGGGDAAGGGIARFFGAAQPPGRQESKESEVESSAGEEVAEDERDEEKKVNDQEDAVDRQEDLEGEHLHSNDLHDTHALSPDEGPPDPATYEQKTEPRTQSMPHINKKTTQNLTPHTHRHGNPNTPPQQRQQTPVIPPQRNQIPHHNQHHHHSNNLRTVIPTKIHNNNVRAATSPSPAPRPPKPNTKTSTMRRTYNHNFVPHLRRLIQDHRSGDGKRNELLRPEKEEEG
ncbi:sister chromatid cohesion protein Eso1 [Hortaea werneckii]|nr:sister chromatid cohesion protein Eso1 [Hortaea werneckii]KAI7696777.1 sister chromatid cohesion protein Eso1 [Hortaea werneckii]